MHLAGGSFAQIATALGKSASAVRKGIEAELAIHEDTDAADEVRRDRAVKSAQLDLLIQGHMAKANGGDVNSAFVCNAAIKEQIRLKGLAPSTKVDINANVSFSAEAHQALLDQLQKYLSDVSD